LDSGEVKPVGASRPFHVNVRVVAATHRELRSYIRKGKFREDLYYRIFAAPGRGRCAARGVMFKHLCHVHLPERSTPSRIEYGPIRWALPDSLHA
jgi:Sigma-54 interaction domain